MVAFLVGYFEFLLFVFDKRPAQFPLPFIKRHAIRFLVIRDTGSLSSLSFCLGVLLLGGHGHIFMIGVSLGHIKDSCFVSADCLLVRVFCRTKPSSRLARSRLKYMSRSM